MPTALSWEPVAPPGLRDRFRRRRPPAARLIRDLITRVLLTPLVEGVGADYAAYRASLLASQIVGLTIAGYIVAIKPLITRPRRSR